MFRRLIRPSGAEIKMMREMDRRNLFYVRQHRVRRGVHVDFAFPDDRLAVECDGDYWHANPKIYSNGKMNRIQKRNSILDKSRNDLIAAEGWKILRFWESQINEDVKSCVDAVEKFLKSDCKSA